MFNSGHLLHHGKRASRQGNIQTVAVVGLSLLAIGSLRPPCRADENSRLLEKPPWQEKVYLSNESLAWQLDWQKAPSGIGEYLAFPSYDESSLTWGKYRFAASRYGLMTAEAGNASKEDWRIFPALYGSSTRIIGESDGLLWIEAEGQGLIALSADLEIKRLLPEVRGHCIAIEKQGFWCLNGFEANDQYQRRATSLIEYAADGTQKRLFKVDSAELTLVQAGQESQTRKSKDAPIFWDAKISWAAVDQDAVWVSLDNYHFAGLGPGDGPMEDGSSWLGRVDRQTGQFTSIKITPEPERTHYNSKPLLFINTRTRVLWLTWGGPETKDVHQLDKKSLAISTAVKLIAPRYDVVVKGPWLWLLAPNPRDSLAYSIEDFTAAPPGKAGQPPPQPPYGIPGYLPYSALWFNVLTSGKNGISLIGLARALIQVPDIGEPRALALSSPNLITKAAANSQWLYAYSPGVLRRIACQDADVTDSIPILTVQPGAFRDADVTKRSLYFLKASEKRVWYQTDDYRLITTELDFSAPREILFALKQKPFIVGKEDPFGSFRATIAVDDALFAWDREGNFIRIDGATGEVKSIESWNGRFPPVAEGPNWPRMNYAYRRKAAFLLPDGRIGIYFSPDIKTSGGPGMAFFEGINDPARLFLYNPADDTWQESSTATAVLPLPSGKEIYGLGKEGLFHWRNDKWEEMSELPAPLRQSIATDVFEVENIWSTKRYLYTRTPLGIYRIEWSQLTGK